MGGRYMRVIKLLLDQVAVRITVINLQVLNAYSKIIQLECCIYWI